MPKTHRTAALGAILRPHRADRAVTIKHLPASPGTTTDWPQWVPTPVRTRFEHNGIHRLWLHQRQTLDALWAGEHVTLTTGTASGKSLPYQTFAEAFAHGTKPPWWTTTTLAERPPTTLYVAPTKALAADQGRTISRVLSTRCAVVDGDATTEHKRWAKTEADLVITNPDWIHAAMLPGATKWHSFLRRLAIIVIDEAHIYRGVFGAHVSLTLRRLQRLLQHLGATPRFVFLSATSASPCAHAEALTGVRPTLIDQNASASPGLDLVLWQPPQDPETGQRRAALTETTELVTDTLQQDVQVLAFTRSRAAAEALASSVASHSPAQYGHRIAAYRGGYLPEERRELEHRIRSGDLLALASTSALELGIDIKGIDATVIVGWPGTRSAMWQRWGRAGRGQLPAVGIFVARNDPLDQYLLAHPDAIFEAPVEHVVVDPFNHTVLAAHLLAAAAELPLTEQNLSLFGPDAIALVEHLCDQGWLRRRGRSWYWTKPTSPTAGLSLRGSATTYDLVDSDTGAIIGTLDSKAVDSEAHPGAVYVHQNRTFLVTDVCETERVVLLSARVLGYRTWAQGTTDVAVERVGECVEGGGVSVVCGWVSVSKQVTHFLLKDAGSGATLGRHSLALPRRSFVTQGVWWTLSREVLVGAGLTEEVLPGALHAAEHALIGLLGLVVTSDRWDVGGLSTVLHADTGVASIFVYDAHPGGAGFSHGGFRRVRSWVEATAEHVRGCLCVAGCPSCVQSPKCGSGNEPLSKAGAVAVLDVLCSVSA